MPSDAEAVLIDYYATFSTLDLQMVLPYFHEPALLIGPQSVFAAPTHVELASAVGPTIEGLRAKGFGRSELEVHYVQSLSATAQLVSGIAHRFKVDGQELERVGVTYVLHNAASVWKIAVLIIHDA